MRCLGTADSRAAAPGKLFELRGPRGRRLAPPPRADNSHGMAVYPPYDVANVAVYCRVSNGTGIGERRTRTLRVGYGFAPWPTLHRRFAGDGDRGPGGGDEDIAPAVLSTSNSCGNQR